MAVPLSHSTPTRQQPKRSAGLPARLTDDAIELRSPLSLATHHPTHNPEPPQPLATSRTPTSSPIRKKTSPANMRIAKSSEQAGYDSAATSAYKRRQYKKNPKRQTKADKLRAEAAAEAQETARFSYLDDLLVFAKAREDEDINAANRAQSRLYEKRTRPADWQITGRRGCPPRPDVWERKIKKQAWEDTLTAKSFNSVLVYTEADDFSTSEDEPDEPQTTATSFTTKVSTPATSFTIPKPMTLLSLLDLAAPFTRVILRTLFSDCIARYGTPDWYSEARLILALSPGEEDWLEARYRGFPDADTLAAATWSPDAPGWHAEACREHRLHRQLKLEHDPLPILAWLDDDRSTGRKVDVSMQDVQLAEEYLRVRGFREATIKEFELMEYANVGDEREGENVSGDDGDGDAVANGVQDEVIETVETDDAAMGDVDMDGNANAESSPARRET